MTIDDIKGTIIEALAEEAAADCVARGVSDAASIQAAFEAAWKRHQAKLDQMLGELHRHQLYGADEPAWVGHIKRELYAAR